jgi:uncharacterized membrane protein HdeD (DUF308 family)
MPALVQRLHCSGLVGMLMHRQPLGWWTIVLRGVATALFGMLCLAAPPDGLPWLVALFGLYALADGMLALAAVTRGVASLVVGTVAVVWPGMTAGELSAVVAAWAIAIGVLDIVRALRWRKQLAHEWLPGFEGALSIALGARLLAPGAVSAVALAIWLGIYALAVAGMLLHSGLRLRTLAHSVVPQARIVLGPRRPRARRT